MTIFYVILLNDYVFYNILYDYMFCHFARWLYMFSIIFYMTMRCFFMTFLFLRFLWYLYGYVFYDIFITKFSMIILIIMFFLAYCILIIVLDNYIRLQVVTSFYFSHQCFLLVRAYILPSSVWMFLPWMVLSLTITTQRD